MCWDRVFSFTPPRRLADMNEGVRQAQRIEETQNLGEETETLVLHWMVKNKHNDIVDLGKQDKGWIGQETTHCSVAMPRTRA